MTDFFLPALEELSKATAALPQSHIDQNKLGYIIRPLMRIVFAFFFLFLIACTIILFWKTPATEGLKPIPLVAAYFIVCVISLFLVIWYRAGNFRLLPYSATLLFILGMGIFLSYINDRHLGDLFRQAFLFVILTPIVLVMVIGAAIIYDPMAIGSPFFRLAYPKRYAHLKTLNDFAISKGWKTSGPEGQFHALNINGVWNGQKIKITAGHRNQKSKDFPPHDFVVVKMGFEEIFLPFHVGDTYFENANPEIAYQATYQAEKNEKSMILVFGENDPAKSRIASQTIQSILASNKFFGGKSTELWTNENFLGYRTGVVKMFEQEAEIQNLLYALEKIGRTMQLNGLTVERKNLL